MRRLVVPFEVSLGAVVALAYAPVLRAGFLSCDDPWLIADNPLFAPGRHDTPLRALTDFSLPTRLALGAEYLPVRDLFVWLETRVFGRAPEPLHALGLALYVAAVLALYRALKHNLGDGVARPAALLFALHPVHVESVAWLSGQKDVLALFFSALALSVHARAPREARWLAPLYFTLACFAKAMSVAIAPLFFVHDWARGRAIERTRALAIAVITGVSLAVHVHVGTLVNMVQEPAGGSHLSAVFTMAPVPLRYLGVLLVPTRTSVVHEVPELGAWSWPALAGVTLCVGWLLCATAWRSRLLALAWAWFFLPLAPVSQLLVPLQNRMADRYLLWSALGVALVFALMFDALRPRLPRSARVLCGALVCAPLGLLSFERCVTFSDSVLLFSDALAKAPNLPLAPYQLGKAWEERGDVQRAERAFSEALRRKSTPPSDPWRGAANNLARIYYRRGELARAERTLEDALRYFPDHPKLLKNLAIVRAARLRMEAIPPKT